MGTATELRREITNPDYANPVTILIPKEGKSTFSHRIIKTGLLYTDFVIQADSLINFFFHRL